MKQLTGFTLLEVLLSLFLITLFLLTLQAAEQAAMRSTRSLHYFTQASLLAQNMSHYLRANQGEMTSYQSLWRKQIQSVLPESNGLVTQKNNGYQIIITWGGIAKEQCITTRTGSKGCLNEQMVLA